SQIENLWLWADHFFEEVVKCQLYATTRGRKSALRAVVELLSRRAICGNQRYEGASAQCLRNSSIPMTARPAGLNSVRLSTVSAKLFSTGCATATSAALFPARSARTNAAKS